MVRRQLLCSSFVALACLGGCSSDPQASSSHGGGSSGGATSNGGSPTGSAAGSSPAMTGGSSSGGANAGGSGNASGSAGAGGPSAGGSSGGSGQAGGSAGTAGAAGATTTLGVRIVGRTAPGSNNGVRFSWPGVNINARFSGTQVSMNVNDGNNKNRFTVVVDGGTPKTITSSSGQTALPLATGLASGTHDLVVWRNTEASIGITEFSGLTDFGTGGALLAPAAAPNRRIEVIGDSLSVGAGVEGTSNDCSAGGGIDGFTNNYLAYGSVAARAVQADVVTIAWSGIGVFRNYSGSDSTMPMPNAPTMPMRYDYSIPNDNTAWEFSKYQPDAVIINLGTNDFSSTYVPANPGQPYVDAYVGFVQHIRSTYANAPMILIDMYGGDRLTLINNVVTALNAAGEKKVAVLSFSSVPNNNTACNSHPNTVAQKAMGDLLTARLKTLLGW